MELLERYLQEIRFWLPKAHQDDIAAELLEDLKSQVNEEENKLGRKLNEAELSEILKKRGRPILVASRYWPQQSLIGPLLFPAYRTVLTIAMLCYPVPWLLVWIGFVSFDPRYRLGHAIAKEGVALFFLASFVAFAVITIIFALLERFHARSRFLDEWDPRSLPPVRDPIRIPRSNSVFELAGNLVFILWWVTATWLQMTFSFGGVRIILDSSLRAILLVFLSIAIAKIVLAIANLFNPYWTWIRGSLRLILNIATAAAFCWLVRTHIFAGISMPDLSAARAADMTYVINTYVSRSFPFVVIACVLIVAYSDVGRLLRLRAARTRLVQGLA